MSIEKKHYVDINLQGNKLVNPTLGTADLSKAGSFGFDNGRVKYYDGTATQDVANLNDLATLADDIAADITAGFISALKFQGAYDVALNSPELEAPAADAVKAGYVYVASSDGEFFTELVKTGDTLIAKIDNPTTLADWIIVQSNIDFATETTAGIVRMAIQDDIDNAVSGAVAVTPAQLENVRSSAQNDNNFVNNKINTEITNRIADVDAEETRALAAEAALQAEIDALNTATTASLMDPYKVPVKILSNDIFQGHTLGTNLALNYIECNFSSIYYLLQYFYAVPGVDAPFDTVYNNINNGIYGTFSSLDNNILGAFTNFRNMVVASCDTILGTSFITEIIVPMSNNDTNYVKNHAHINEIILTIISLAQQASSELLNARIENNLKVNEIISYSAEKVVLVSDSFMLNTSYVGAYDIETLLRSLFESNNHTSYWLTAESDYNSGNFGTLTTYQEQKWNALVQLRTNITSSLDTNFMNTSFGGMMDTLTSNATNFNQLPGMGDFIEGVINAVENYNNIILGIQTQESISNKFFTIDILTTDWVDNTGSYSATINHGFNLLNITALSVTFMLNGESADFHWAANNGNIISVVSNFVPTDTISVSLVKTGI